MILARYAVNDETALTADFAEYYHIYDWRHQLPLKTAAALAAGLRYESRSVMLVNGVTANLRDSLLALIHDDLQVLQYQHAGKRARKPKLIYEDIVHHKEKTEDYKCFEDGRSFIKAWEELSKNG